MHIYIYRHTHSLTHMHPLDDASGDDDESLDTMCALCLTTGSTVTYFRVIVIVADVCVAYVKNATRAIYELFSDFL